MAGGLLRRDGTAATERATERRETASALPEAAWAAIRDEVVEGLPEDWGTRVATDSALRREVEERIRAAVDRVVRQQPGVSRAAALAEARDELLGFGPLQRLLSDPEITEIMVNGPGRVRVERAGGRLEWTDVRFRSDDHLRAVVRKILSPLGRELTESSPLADGRLPDGARVSVVGPPLALRGISVNIRRFPQAYSVGDLVQLSSMSQEVADLLAVAVRARANIVVSGGTSSGKTTLLNALSSFADEDEHIVTIEDAAELQLRQPDVVALEARQPNMEGVGAIPLRRLVSQALRMRPDRILVGEVRGGEALDMLQAMNTGHEGSLTTVHANSASDAIERLTTLTLMADSGLSEAAIRRQIASAIEVIVQVARSVDGRRRVTEVAEVVGLVDGEVVVKPIVRWDGAAWRPTGHRPERLLAKFERAGVDAPALLLKGKEAAD